MKREKLFFDDQQTSGNNTPIWMLKPVENAFKPLYRDLETDVLVVGGGVAGLMTAYQLLDSGKSVVLVEDGEIGSGETGRTSAHLTYSLDTQYAELVSRMGEEQTRLIGDAHKTAIDWIENLVKREKIECHFKRVDGYLFAHPTDDESILDKEYEVTNRIGLKTDLLETVPGFLKDRKQRCLRVPHQAQFHVLLFLNGLANAVARKGGNIFIRSKAKEFTENSAIVNGFKVTAKQLVIATNTPVAGPLITHTKQWPYRTYAIAAKIPKGSIDHALWWDTGDKDVPWVQKPYHYVRIEEGTEQHDYLIVGGEDYRTGQEDREEIPAEIRYKRLETWARAHFPLIIGIAAKWSGQVINTVDGCGFIGKNPGSETTFIITGDSGNGITNAAIGAQLITDLIHGKENKWTAAFDPSRSVMLHAPGDYLKEVGNMVRQYAEWLMPGDQKTMEELKRGEGAVLREGLKKIAVYRDENDQLHTCTAVCPHLGAIVQWNADEKTFDCPAHGSRFSALGEVINGPSNGNLGEKDV
ncbi:MAG: FAD-dependent oxidoreductase [Candidatus Fluviicola riflensis]|nr:MAG: (2Fe-2S)-binding protein [Candidatus Fluviicola riflensis]OGS79435.1 MAG: FAD-dependent oxidoreductase [Candidatus Fluviicola riflensis]OGS86867.1 MAG: FAD-dependent oxidoreductase [Fluviicola sp. RIFCSPHIGHO2_01_FULL_43_53]OGS89657.1 MAG: FAD-dependent oxidoreductase [Fluviicola sp. RIFCSPHIGHO2_12_FULL_43_24]